MQIFKSILKEKFIKLLHVNDFEKEANKAFDIIIKSGLFFQYR